MSEPGPALRRLAHSTDDDRLWQRLQHDHSEDALSAFLLLENRQRQHIYLLSDLDESTVEVAGGRLYHGGRRDRPPEPACRYVHLAGRCPSAVPRVAKKVRHN